MNNLIGILIGTSSSRPTLALNYVDIPDRPALGTSATLTYSAPGNILNSTGGDTQDKILSGAWEQFHGFSFVGTDPTHRRISNQDNNVVIGSIANHLFTREGTNSDYFEINGKSQAEPLYFEDVGGIAATSAIQISAFATGPHVWLSNIVSNCRGYAVFANTAGTLSGGDANTPPSSSANYQDLELSFIRSFNVVDNKEHFYIGATTTNTYAIHHAFSGKHLLGYQCEWDGLQVLNATDFILSNLTIVNSGSDGETNDAQDSNIQVQNAYGIVANSIFYNAPQAARFSTYDLVFRNNYVHWTGTELEDVVQIVGYVENYASGNRLMPSATGKEILIEDCDFVADNWTGALIQVLDGEVNITVRNCRIEGPTSLFDTSGIGASPTGTLTDGGGNTFVASGTIPTPTFTNFDPTDFENHGKLTQAYHYSKGRGFRTPIKEVVSAETISDVSVPFATTFATLLSDYLPETADLTLDNSSVITVTINWIEGSYDENTSGEYTLIGTIDSLPNGVSNITEISFSVDITVEEEIFPPEEFGMIHSDNFDSGTLTPYTQTGTKFTATGSNLRINTTTGGHGEYLRVTTPNVASAHATHMLEKWKMSATFIAPAAGGTNYGFGMGIRSTNSFTTYSTACRIAFDAALPKGSIYFYEHVNGVVSQTSSNATFTPVTGVTYIYEVERNKNVYTTRIKSADGLTTHQTLSRTFSLSSSASGWINNVGNFCIWAYGATNLDITNLTIETTALKYAELLGAGDSNMWGAWATSNAIRYVEQAATNAGLQFEICAGVDAGINDIPLTSIIALEPQKIYVNIGSNDEANGVADATWQSRFATMFSTLDAAGYDETNVIIGIPCARNGQDMAAIKTYLDANYSAYTRVDLYTATKQPANTSLQVAYNGGDNIHMSAAGNNACAAVLEPIITP